MTRSVNGRSWSGPAPGARIRSWPRRSCSLDSSAIIHAPARSSMSLPRRRGWRPVKIRLLKAARAHRDDTSRSFRAAAHVPGTDTPQSPATPQKPYRAPTRKVTAGGSSATKAVKVTAANSPAENDATGVGSDTIQNVLDQFGADFNAGKASTATRLYSWDATNPNTGAIGDSIAEKSGCSPIARPDGSSAGITQLATFQKTGDGKFFCSSFARSSRARGSSDPAFAPGGIAFVDLGGDAVTWSAQATTNAPATLTTAQLAAIYNCTDTNWSQVGGKNAPIHAFIPQSGSGTRSFFLGAIGIATPGSCVSDDSGLLEENEGVNPVLHDPDAIFPYSTGKYIAEKFHSNLCITTSTCAPNANGIVCKHTPGKNLFGCDTHGTMALKQINGIAPTTGTGANTVINSSFPATFQRTVYEVVPFDPATTDHIPGATSPVGGVNLEKLFGASGFVCSNSKAKTDL